jgi:hypothetical protein
VGFKQGLQPSVQWQQPAHHDDDSGVLGQLDRATLRIGWYSREDFIQVTDMVSRETDKLVTYQLRSPGYMGCRR